MKLRTIAQAFGAAITLLILRVWSLLSSYHPVLYHSFLPMQSVVWGVLIQVGAVSLLAGLLFVWLCKRESGWRSVIWAFVAAEMASSAVGAATTVHRGPIPFLASDPAYWAVLVGSLVFRWVRPLDYLRAVRALGVLLALVGCSMVWMIPELLYQALRAQRIDTPVPVIAATQASPASSSGRIVWLLFDELSYDQTFDHRFPGVAMPAFDDLKRKSVVFSDLRPAGYHTDRVIPAFFLGKPVDNIRGTLDGDLMLRYPGNRKWQAFDAQATVFADAQRLGWTTGVAGWYNPYCRILAGTLNYCFWRMAEGLLSGAIPDESAWHNAVVPLRDRWRAFRHETLFEQQKQAQDYVVVMKQAEALLRDENIRFVFIHLPVPHPPGVNPGGGYISNLAVADQSLSELLKTLDATSLAANTTLIVCSDHAWRVAIWRPTGFWTKQDEAASHGVFDPRPVLMIHSPGQRQEQDVTAPFDEVRIHDILERLLHGQTSAIDPAVLAGSGH